MLHLFYLKFFPPSLVDEIDAKEMQNHASKDEIRERPVIISSVRPTDVWVRRG